MYYRKIEMFLIKDNLHVNDRENHLIKNTSGFKIYLKLIYLWFFFIYVCHIMGYQDKKWTCNNITAYKVLTKCKKQKSKCI